MKKMCLSKNSIIDTPDTIVCKYRHYTVVAKNRRIPMKITGILIVMVVFSSFISVCVFNMSSVPTSNSINSYPDHLNPIWNRTWGITSKRCTFSSITGYGSYIYVAGSDNISGTNDDNIIILKYDIYGNEIWNRSWKTNQDDKACSIITDGSYIYIGGITYNPSTGKYMGFILKYDVNGNYKYNMTWGGAGDNLLRSMSFDGTYFMRVRLSNQVPH
jgi:hypothetical protein